jgi:hypothetical protein
MKTVSKIALLLAAALMAASALLARPEPSHDGPAPSSGEMQASVPELSEFHEVIFKLWHEAWPRKDMAMLSSLLPGIEAGAAKIQKAVLPGILRDKKAAWEAGVGRLSGIVADYRTAVGARDLQKTLDAGESLHSQFEALVRVIRPALAEVDAFHQALYRLYHYELPSFSLPMIQASAKELKVKMSALEAAALPARLESKKEAFAARRKDLGAAVSELAALAEAGRDEKAIREAVEAVHARYVSLEQVF